MPRSSWNIAVGLSKENLAGEAEENRSSRGTATKKLIWGEIRDRSKFCGVRSLHKCMGGHL